MHNNEQNVSGCVGCLFPMLLVVLWWFEQLTFIGLLITIIGLLVIMVVRLAENANSR